MLRLVGSYRFLFFSKYFLRQCYGFKWGLFLVLELNSYLQLTLARRQTRSPSSCIAFHFALHKIDDSNPTNANELTFYFVAISLKSLTEVIIMGQIMSFISQYDASRKEFREKFENVNNFLSSMNAPSMLRKNIRNYYRFLWWRDQGTADPSVLIDHLNDGVVGDIKFHLNGSILRSVKIFMDSPDGFIRDLCKRLRPHLFVPGGGHSKTGGPWEGDVPDFIWCCGS